MINVIFYENRKLTFALSSLAKKSTEDNCQVFWHNNVPPGAFVFSSRRPSLSCPGVSSCPPP